MGWQEPNEYFLKNLSLGKPLFVKWSVYMSIAQKAFDPPRPPPALCQSGTIAAPFLGPIFSDGRHNITNEKHEICILPEMSIRIKYTIQRFVKGHPCLLVF